MIGRLLVVELMALLYCGQYNLFKMLVLTPELRQGIKRSTINKVVHKKMLIMAADIMLIQIR